MSILHKELIPKDVLWWVALQNFGLVFALTFLFSAVASVALFSYGSMDLMFGTTPWQLFLCVLISLFCSSWFSMRFLRRRNYSAKIQERIILMSTQYAAMFNISLMVLFWLDDGMPQEDMSSGSIFEIVFSILGFAVAYYVIMRFFMGKVVAK